MCRKKACTAVYAYGRPATGPFASLNSLQTHRATHGPHIISPALCQAAWPAHSPPPIQTWPASLWALIFLALFMGCVSRTRGESRSWGHLRAALRSVKVFQETAWEGGWRHPRVPTALRPTEEPSGTMSIFWGREKNKSALHGQLSYPGETSQLSWLPQ